MHTKNRELENAFLMVTLNALAGKTGGAASWYAHALILHDHEHQRAQPGALEKSTALIRALGRL